MTSKEGTKLDAGKTPIASACLRYFPRALTAVTEQSVFGAKKYNLSFEDKNFLKVDDGIARYTDALIRHLLKEELDAEGIDPESNTPHTFAVAWCALARLEMILLEKENKEVAEAQEAAIAKCEANIDKKEYKDASPTTLANYAEVYENFNGWGTPWLGAPSTCFGQQVDDES